jgi:hypothetical protein
MAKKKQTETQIVNKIVQNNNNYNLLESIDSSIENYMNNNNLSDDLKNKEDELVDLLKQSQALIMDIQHILQSESKLMFNNLKKSK